MACPVLPNHMPELDSIARVAGIDAEAYFASSLESPPFSWAHDPDTPARSLPRHAAATQCATQHVLNAGGRVNSIGWAPRRHHLDAHFLAVGISNTTHQCHLLGKQYRHKNMLQLWRFGNDQGDLNEYVMTRQLSWPCLLMEKDDS